MSNATQPWSTIEAARAFCSFGSDVPDAEVQFLLDAATDVLHVHSAQQFNGGIQETVRPCKVPGCLTFEFAFFPSTSDFGPGGPFPSPAFRISCGCEQLQELEFDYGPINSVDQILINGTVFPETNLDGSQNWRVDENRWLVRVDGGTWPTCQDLSLPATASNTWQVQYTWGRTVPEIGVLAVNQLTCECIKAYVGTRCQLPPRTTRIIRQGVSIQLQDIKNDEERTGLYFVDVFLRTYNPQGLRSEPYLWSPDLLPRGRRVGTS